MESLYRENSNRMTPKDHLAAGPTRKVVVLKDLSNAPYPQWAGGGFDDFLNLMNFLVFLIL